MANRVPIWRGKVRKWGDIKSFFRRHNTRLIFFGALVVFTTFVIKDVLREQLKDLMDSVESAHSIFVLRHDTSMLNFRLQYLQGTADALADKLVRSKMVTQDGLRKDATAKIVLLDEQLDNLFVYCDNVARLVEKLPEKMSMTHHLHDLVDATEHRALHQRAILEHLREGEELKTLDSKSSSVVGTTILEIQNAIPQLDFAIMTYGEMTMREAERAKDVSKQTYGRWTRISYGLYALGWGLGLVGKLCSVQGLAGGE
jgi:hypothetical protein